MAADGDPDPKARGPREKPHDEADRARWWGWRRTRPEPTRSAIIGRLHGLANMRPTMMLSGVPVVMVTKIKLPGTPYLGD